MGTDDDSTTVENTAASWKAGNKREFLNSTKSIDHGRGFQLNDLSIETCLTKTRQRLDCNTQGLTNLIADTDFSPCPCLDSSAVLLTIRTVDLYLFTDHHLYYLSTKFSHICEDSRKSCALNRKK